MLIGATLLLIIIIAAYIDGGDEAVRPIEHEIQVPLPYKPEPPTALRLLAPGRSGN